jgi:hypothetical protein
MDWYSVRRIASQYHYYWYAILTVNTLKADFTLLQRFTIDSIRLITSYIHLIIITIRITTYPTIPTT